MPSQEIELNAIPPRRGRPPGFSRRELGSIALRLFSERGYDETTVDDIAAETGVSPRTFFRYFGTKTGVLWFDFDDEVTALRNALAAVPANVSPMVAIRRAVVSSVKHATAEDVPELRTRMALINSAPALQASAGRHYDAWEQVVIDFAAERLDLSPTDLLPLAIGRATRAVCRAAYERWMMRTDADLTAYLGDAITALARGFRAER
jgi:mycofactocin system transcriptional regulator